MTIYFADTSAIAKRYVDEPGSAWVRSWSPKAAGHIVIVSDLLVVEMHSLLARKYRENRISYQDLLLSRETVVAHTIREYIAVNIDQQLLIIASELVGKYVLRVLDAIQLASALRAVTTLGEQMIFVTADRNLSLAAAVEGLAPDDPNLYP